MTWFGLLGLTLGWAYSVFRDAGTATDGWAVAVAVIGLIAAVYFGFAPKEDKPPRPSVLVVVLLFGLLVFAALQVVPLPVSLVQAISPARAAMAKALAPVFGPAKGVPLSNNVDLTMQRGIQLLGCILTLLLVRDLFWRRRHKPWSVVAPLLAVAGVEATIGLVQYRALGTSAVARGTYVNQNHFAGLLEMCLPFAVMYGLAIMKRTGSRFSSPAGPALLACVPLALAALMLLGVLFSLSRMGFVATLSALLVVAALALGSGGQGWRRWAPSGAVGLIGALALVFLPTDQLIARFARFAATEEISGDARALIWKDTLNVIGDYPAVGCGFGAFEPTIVRYQTVAPLNTLNFAHNDYLQFVAELGFPAALGALTLFVWVMFGSLKATAAPDGGELRYLALGCMGAFTALLLHSLVDFNMYVPANAMLAAWIGGVAEGLRAHPARRPSRWKQAGLPEFIE